MESILWVHHTAEPRKQQIASMKRGALITTFRMGPKWLRAELVGQRVQLVNCKTAHVPPCSESCEVFGFATVVSVKHCKFKDIEVWDHVRQSSDMTDDERLDIMRSVYGPDYSGETPTTVITMAVE